MGAGGKCRVLGIACLCRPGVAADRSVASARGPRQGRMFGRKVTNSSCAPAPRTPRPSRSPARCCTCPATAPLYEPAPLHAAVAEQTRLVWQRDKVATPPRRRWWCCRGQGHARTHPPGGTAHGVGGTSIRADEAPGGARAAPPRPPRQPSGSSPLPQPARRCLAVRRAACSGNGARQNGEGAGILHSLMSHRPWQPVIPQLR